MTNVSLPTTRLTLLDLLRQDPSDQAGWDEFVERYGRHIYRWCRQWKLQDADAKDVTQNILVKLTQKLEEAFDLELLEAAKVRVRLRVAPHTWEAFRLMALESLPVAEVAARVHLQVAMVYVAKSKVQKMLQEEIGKLESGL